MVGGGGGAVASNGEFSKSQRKLLQPRLQNIDLILFAHAQIREAIYARVLWAPAPSKGLSGFHVFHAPEIFFYVPLFRPFV